MGKYDNCFLFWGIGNAGYYRSIEDCEIYTDDKDKDYLIKYNRDDFLVSKSLVEKYKQKIVLPQYGERKELYAQRNDFFVLPNTGQVRKALGITTLDIHLDGDRNSFNAYFQDTHIEEFKYSYSKTHFSVKAKQEKVDGWWHYQDYSTEAKTRNEAILKAKKDWWFDEDYIEFKSMVTCSRTRTKVLNKWIEL
jgi:L-rhamnose mutarotase